MKPQDLQTLVYNSRFSKSEFVSVDNIFKLMITFQMFFKKHAYNKQWQASNKAWNVCVDLKN